MSLCASSFAHIFHLPLTKLNFYGVHELDFVTGCDTDLSLRGLISADQFVISFFFSFFFYLRLLL